MLSDANTIPVRGGKSWTVSSNAAGARDFTHKEVDRSREVDHRGTRGRHEQQSMHPRVSFHFVQSSRVCSHYLLKMNVEKIMSMDDPQKIEASFRETIKARCSFVPYVTPMLTIVGNF